MDRDRSRTGATDPRAKGEAPVRVAVTDDSDLTASDFGGYQAVLAIHAEGSIEAEKLTIFRQYDAERAKAYARKMAGIE